MQPSVGQGRNSMWPQENKSTAFISSKTAASFRTGELAGVGKTWELCKTLAAQRSQRRDERRAGK